VVGVERPEPLMHGLVATAEFVEDVADGGYVEVLADPG
jgi:hypothetical protein